MQKLAFGYGAGVPEGAPAAWGARAIVNGYGYGRSLDVPHDRVSFAGDEESKAALIAKLKEVGPIALAEAKIGGLTPSDEPVTIYEDSEFAVVGRLAGDYFYLAAYLRPAEPGILVPRKGDGPPGTPEGAPVWLKLVRRIIALDGKDAENGIFKLLAVGPGEDGQYRESYLGADIVFPSYDDEHVRIVPKDEQAEAIILKVLESLTA